ncbi:class I SAM-dependent methyltransferase [Sutcliffiella cohnii]|uniref:Protein-L-IsoD(D-D) O-methyltransferase n=1 Tax=Sutcliffiella cohnii TaxID=33932 RepID=A0A223KQP7_9BACI|nr:class I SAM-dependent methyltransferase [Sutcliffiella cohnii]AST91736.1 hypothetical protein BC6307_10830 [Sutcliffiella cohnii]MED4014710.1 class I SAM-dependent methyltransferase [Sutcliffiella cohnii]
MYITTAGRTDETYIQKAKQLALHHNFKYINRNKLSIEALHNKYNEDIIVVGKERLELFKLGKKEPIFFHPNSAAFRLKRLIKGETEPFLEVTKLQNGMSFLDCTLGLASDSIIASYIVGKNGKVTGLEGNRTVAFIVQEGLKTWPSENEALVKAMERVQVVTTDHKEYLQTLDSNSYDVVYFDPMFTETIEESQGILPLKSVAIYEGLTELTINEAYRVAKSRVVLKDHWKSDHFKKFNFQVQVRKTAKFHFGVLEK